MPMINTMNLLSAGVELFAASIMAILLLGCWEERQYRTKTNRLFVAVLSIQTLLLIGDSAIWLLRADTGQNPAGKNAHIDYRHHDGGPDRSLYLFPFQLHLSKKAYFFCVSPRCIGYMRCGHPALDILFVQ